MRGFKHVDIIYKELSFTKTHNLYMLKYHQLDSFKISNSCAYYENRFQNALLTNFSEGQDIGNINSLDLRAKTIGFESVLTFSCCVNSLSQSFLI